MPEYETEEDPTTAVWDEVERRAIDEHARCLKYWRQLEQHDKWRHDHMTTFHGIAAHYRNEKGKDRIPD